ncbi:ribonuclease E [Rhodococcoides trifolii]|uniref:Ribonuclease E n=1 Tax=Rhodococcoides trifolii TaxID=908250 RepID=A0A917D0Z4_9NOCA|nr:translation initiation factor IF-2 N-terminal domain-containing protein [Rhodococcus trifolii]GGG02525.1 ribonuclease E [Rhodococcus trifolii]
MADHEPPQTSSDSDTGIADTGRTDTGGADTGSADPALPERIRVHALAKRLGVTSKQVMAQLVEMGSPARNVQSSVVRADAEAVINALGAVPTADAPALADTPEPAEQAIDSIPDVGAPEPAEPSQTPQPDLFTNIEAPVQSTPPVGTSAAMPLFVQPETPSDDAPVKAPARKRRRAKSETPKVETPEAETPEVQTPAVETSDDTDASPEKTPVGDTESGDIVAPASTDADSSDDSGPDSGDDQESSGPRRRRRGRRGRGRGRGEQQDSDDSTDDGESDDSSDDTVTKTDSADVVSSDDSEKDSSDLGAEKDNSDDDQSDDDDSDSDSGSRRRRRRRRRKSTGDSSTDSNDEDDPPNTVVHEREPRNKQRAPKDEVQGISGSTRLEAKRQRRRDGRDAGRRRPPILTESEFLARREAVDRTMVVREKALAGHPDLTQVAVLEDGVLVEHFVTSTSSGSISGNVYLGRVQNVLPSMEAAFIDIGKGRNGVLYAGEVDWEAAGLGGSSRKIEQALKPGDQVLVQVSKDPVGHKGARLTTQISLAGRFLVYVPGGSSTGISRKLPDTERKRLKDILRDIVPADAGVIIRTASEGVSAEELARDVTRLQAQWATISDASSKAESSKGSNPQSLYEEPDLLVKVVRDLFNEDFSKLVIEGDRAWSTVQSYIETVAPDMLPRVERYEASSKDIDVFAAYRIDEQLAKALDRKVWLPSGGTLVIDRTEAMTVVDVNTGKFTGEGGNLEETVTRNNLEAAEEIVRQMRLRDIGGMIVVDFIDMVLESNRDLVLRRLTEALGRDRTRHQVSEVTSLGLVQMTRKRMGTGLIEAFSTTCEHCHGRGIMIHQFPVEPKSDEGRSGGNNSGGNSGNGGGNNGGGSQRSDQTSGNNRRRRGGKDKNDTRTDAAPVESEKDAVDVTAKRAHPVALAMAAHLHPDDEAEAIEVDGAEVVAYEDPAETAAAAVEAVREAESASSHETEKVAEPENAAKAEDVAKPAAEPESDPTPATKPRRSRRVSRAAAAPAGEAAGTVIVIPQGASAPEPAEPAVTAPAGRASVAPATAPTRPKRRRAAGRPAGPPVDGE